jgi:hypothetical protein
MEVEEMNIEDLFEDEAHDRDEDDPDEVGQEQVTKIRPVIADSVFGTS